MNPGFILFLLPVLLNKPIILLSILDFIVNGASERPEYARAIIVADQNDLLNSLQTEYYIFSYLNMYYYLQLHLV